VIILHSYILMLMYKINEQLHNFSALLSLSLVRQASCREVWFGRCDVNPNWGNDACTKYRVDDQPSIDSITLMRTTTLKARVLFNTLLCSPLRSSKHPAAKLNGWTRYYGNEQL
jgi:hypothetical protein